MVHCQVLRQLCSRCCVRKILHLDIPTGSVVMRNRTILNFPHIRSAPKISSRKMPANPEPFKACMSSNVQPFKIILGSSSLNRRKILTEMGYQFSIMTADIDEKAIRKEEPEELVLALAEAKADAIIARLQGEKDYQNGGGEQPTLLITADQVVVHKGKIIEKPSCKEEAREFIKGYSGSCASTVGSVVVSNLKTGSRRGGWDKTEVYFHEIPEEIINDLIEDDAIFYIAGGLNLENPLTSPLVNAMVGTIDSVRGLPKALTEKLLQDAISEHFL